MGASDDDSMDSGHAAGMYNCHQSDCNGVFHRLSSLERHLSLEKCAYGPGQNGLQTLLGIRGVVLLKTTIRHQEALVCYPGRGNLFQTLRLLGCSAENSARKKF